ncbi:MAG TPA: DUF2783 domain-containing protein [Ideonella sp.]|uniref:DUF2783 domain-containing protein n=1 Tax=Ideonella sp. TaxID=1929293 RepID=UPI002CA3AD94|nr:DUF2783 domain-containing protein [Ideonella sp.]HSI50875.1 DUF2783 domain-containing protein [Ideonella sp.]
MALILTPNLAAPDDFYEALITAHQGLDTAASHALNARLVLLLANHIGDLAVLREALQAARDSGPVPLPASSNNDHRDNA